MVLLLLVLMMWKSSRRGDRLETLHTAFLKVPGERAAASKDCGLGQLRQPTLVSF